MFPFDEYSIIRRRQEDLLRQAECERLLRTLQRSEQLHRTLALWLGTHLVKWGQKLEQLGTLKNLHHSSSLPGSIDM